MKESGKNEDDFALSSPGDWKPVNTSQLSRSRLGLQ